MNNFFNLINAENLRCKIKQYQNNLLEIIVLDISGIEVCALVFTPTYIQCPMEWKGADFRLSTPAELLELSEILSINMTKEEVLKYSQLFVAQVDIETASPKVVRILASRVEKY